MYLYLIFGGGGWLNTWFIVQLFNFLWNAWRSALLVVFALTSLSTDKSRWCSSSESSAGIDFLAYSTDRYCPLTFNWCKRSNASVANCWDTNFAKVTVYLFCRRVLVFIAPYLRNNESRRSSDNCGGRWRILKVSHTWKYKQLKSFYKKRYLDNFYFVAICLDYYI